MDKINIVLGDPETFYWNYLLNDTTFLSIMSQGIPDNMPYCGVFAYLYFYKLNDAIFEYKKRYLSIMEEECKKNDKDLASGQMRQLAKICPFVRDLLFADEKRALDACETVDDFELFIERKPVPYEEYLLCAKYKLSNILNSHFDEYNEVLREYPTSDIIDVKHILDQCETINGLEILWNDSVLPLQRSYIRELLASMTHLDDSVLGNACWVHFQPLSKRLVYGLLHGSKLLELILGKEYSPAYILSRDVNELLIILYKETGLKFAVPSVDMLSKFLNVAREDFQHEQYEWCADEQNYNIILSKHEGHGYLRIKELNEPFATLRLIINN